MTEKRQDDLSRQRRLNNGTCPVHGLRLVPGEFLVDAQVYECPRETCDFQIVPKPGTKCYVALHRRLERVK